MLNGHYKRIWAYFFLKVSGRCLQKWLIKLRQPVVRGEMGEVSIMRMVNFEGKMKLFSAKVVLERNIYQA